MSSTDAVQEMLRKKGLLVQEAWDDSSDEEEEQRKNTSEDEAKKRADEEAAKKAAEETSKEDEDAKQKPQGTTVSESHTETKIDPEKEMSKKPRASVWEEEDDWEKEMSSKSRDDREEEDAKQKPQGTTVSESHTETKIDPEKEMSSKSRDDREHEDAKQEPQGTSVSESRIEHKEAEKDPVKEMLRKRGLLVEDAWEDEDAQEDEDAKQKPQGTTVSESHTETKIVPEEEMSKKPRASVWEEEDDWEKEMSSKSKDDREDEDAKQKPQPELSQEEAPFGQTLKGQDEMEESSRSSFISYPSQERFEPSRAGGNEERGNAAKFDHSAGEEAMRQTGGDDPKRNRNTSTIRSGDTFFGGDDPRRGKNASTLKSGDTFFDTFGEGQRPQDKTTKMSASDGMRGDNTKRLSASDGMQGDSTKRLSASDGMRGNSTKRLSATDGMRNLQFSGPRTLGRSYGSHPTAEDCGVLKRPIFLKNLSHIRSLPKIKFGEKRPTHVATDTPGPGSYVLAEPGRTSKFREHTIPSFGSGASRFGFGDNPSKVRPAPGQYGIPKNPVQEMQRKAAFSMYPREHRHHYIVTEDDPGPGAYEVKSTIGRGMGISAKGKIPKVYNPAKALPGPGAYDPKEDGLSKFSSGEQIGMGTSVRTNWAELHCRRTPGPGAYNNESYGELGKSSLKFSLKGRMRKQTSFDPYVTPGPGSYNAHGTSFGY